ncbi:hypothetical protein [Atopomonas hussainii]|uniref:hypothetical protein n=1 Tax=Atopomonas hussainii TaxID=1429083 RepID=UPI000943F55E|nr:hypothetical protein [Atopomonas hussainii]
MKQKLKIIFTALGFIAFFFAGAFWQKWQLLESGVFKLTKPLKLQASPDTTGTLPAGTTLYKYASAGEIETFVIFLQTKNLGLLKPHNFDNQLTVNPIDGYLE